MKSLKLSMKSLIIRKYRSETQGRSGGLLCCMTVVAAVLLLVSCKDDINSTYSTKYPVRFYFEVATSSELYNAIGNPGQFVSIRAIGGKIRISNSLGSNDYSLSQIGSREFEYGLGGLIVGTSSTPNMQNGFDLMAYDLACPKCDRQTYRLSLHDNGTALCSHCGTSYDLNNYGWVIGVAEEAQPARALLRYRIAFNGVAINVSNR